MRPTVYILASGRRGTLYVGVTSAPVHRIAQHRSGVIPGFTQRHRVHLLVYVEFHARMIDAIRREKQIKEWKRVWKLELIERANPEWRDLSDELWSE
jgi:putative endonuclease